MKLLFAGVLLVAGFAAAGCSSTGMSASVQLRSAPPPPAIQFDRDPQFSYLSNRHVSVLSDDSFGYDMFRSGGTYYLYNGGYWYQSRTPRGPFVAVEARRVPRRIFDVDDHEHRWRNHPQGWRAGQQQGDGSDRPPGRGGH